MRLPRLTTRRILVVTVIVIAATLVLAVFSMSGDWDLAAIGIVSIWLLWFTTALPFFVYRLFFGRLNRNRVRPRKRPPRLARVTARNIVIMIAIITVAMCTLIVFRHARARARGAAAANVQRNVIAVHATAGRGEVAHFDH